MAAGMVYGLISIPLALHFLPKNEFGLWAVMTQVVGYIVLIELGMTSSVARHLIEHKDRPQDGIYGSVIQTGTLVLVVQGLIIFLIGFSLSPLFARLLAIPADLEHPFIVLLRWQTGIMAVDFAMRICSQILYAHQRSDLSSYGDILGFGVNLLALWIAFDKGFGLYSILWASGFATVCSASMRLVICWKWRMFPSGKAWGRPNWVSFKELFHYGKDVFLVTLGYQLTNASQTIIITRTLGLDAAAVWSICTKLFLFVVELIGRIINSAGPMLSEMVVRHETERLRSRFRDIVEVTGSISVFAAVALAVCNQPFVRIWTGGKIFWTPWNDVLLGGWLVIRSLLRCHIGLTFISKKFESLRFMVFAEGLAFVIFTLLTSRFGGIPMIIGISIVCSVSLTGNYIARRTAQNLGYPLREVVFGWFSNAVRVVLLLVPVALLTWWISLRFSLKWRLVWDVVVLGTSGGLLWLRFGIPIGLQVETIRRSPPPLAAILKRCFPAQR